MSNHLNKPSEELVLDLINVANNRSFTLTDVNIRDPIVHAENGKNTRAIAEGIPGSGYVGSDVIFYNRLDLNTAMPNNDQDGLFLYVPNDGPVDTYEVCDRLNKMFNYQIGPEDVVYAPVDSETLPVEVTIQALPGSLAWTGQKVMTLVADRPMWGSTFSSLVLNGFNVPTGDVSALTDPVATGNSSPTFVNAGNLLFGTSLPATGMLKSTNSELEVALSVRVGDGSVVTVPDADNAYNLTLLGESTWKMIFSVGLLAGGVLDDLYSTCVIVTRPDNSTYTFTLQRDGAGYTLVNAADSLSIPMEYAAGDLSVTQGALDAATIGAFLNAAGSGGGGAPLGLYSVRIQARRKNSVAPRLLATILVKAYNN